MQLHLAREPRLAMPGGRELSLAALDAALLAWLALEGPTPRARLAQLLWPDKDAEAARNSLRQRLFQLRKSLGTDLVQGSTTLALADGIAHDLDDADGVLGQTAGEDLAAGEFAQWLERQRQRRRDRVHRSLSELADMAEQARDWDDALTHARELLALEPLSEAAHRRLMRLHYLCGDRAAALLAFDACECVLKDEVGTSPSAETLALLALLQQGQAVAGNRPAPRAAPAGLSRPPRLIGRDPELAQLADGLERGQVVFVVGEAGMGKTRLLDALRESAPGWVYASARPGDASVPFASIARVLREVAGASHPTLTVIEPAQRRALARLLPEIDDAAPRGEGEAFRGALEQAVQSFLWARSAVRGLLLDDLHFADRASLELLSALLADAGRDAAVPRCALAFRPAEAGSPLVALQDALLDRLHLETIALQPLTEAALAALIDSLGVSGLDGAALAPTVHRRTGGNPMFVLETLKQAWADGALHGRGALAAPASIGRLIERRLAHLSSAALTLARVASLAGVDFELALAEQVLGTSAMQLADAINELEAAQVMRGKIFAHDLVFETVRAGIPPAVAVHTHGQIAAWLEGRNGEPARMAEHWIAAEQPARAIRPLSEAARRAAQRTAYSQAATFAERAAALARSLGNDELEFEALDELTEYTTYEDPGPRADAALDRMDALAQGEDRQLRAMVARCLQMRRRQIVPQPEYLHAWLDTALRLGREGPAGTLVVIGAGMYVALGQPDAALALVQQHRALLEGGVAADDLPSLYGTLGVALANLDRFGEALVWMDRAEVLDREIGDKVETMRVLVNNLRYYRGQGRLQHALERWQVIERWHTAEAPNPVSYANATSGMAEALCDMERYGDALALIEHDSEATRRAVGRLGLAWPVARAKIWLALGQSARALQALQAGEPDRAAAPGWLDARWLLLRARTEARLQGQRPDRPGDAALAWLEQAARAAPRDHRRLSWFECELQRAAWSKPAAGAALAEMVASLAQQQGMIGHALHARCRAAERLLAEDRIDAARQQWQQAQTLRRWRFGNSSTDEPVFPSGLTLIEVEWIELALLHKSAKSVASSRAAEVTARLRALAETGVAAEFRDAFLHRHPVNCELFALAGRVTAD